MSYRVTGVGLEPVEYLQETLASAAHLARRMADNGVRDIHVFDADGRELTEDELRNAPLPPGWVRLKR
jgi:hypothetical protein